MLNLFTSIQTSIFAQNTVSTLRKHVKTEADTIRYWKRQFPLSRMKQWLSIQPRLTHTDIFCEGAFSASDSTGSSRLRPPCWCGKVFMLFRQICLLGLFSASRNHLRNICFGWTTHLVHFTHTNSRNTLDI